MTETQKLELVKDAQVILRIVRRGELDSAIRRQAIDAARAALTAAAIYDIHQRLAKLERKPRRKKARK